VSQNAHETAAPDLAAGRGHHIGPNADLARGGQKTCTVSIKATQISERDS
jgi:hypothetical protein